MLNSIFAATLASHRHKWSWLASTHGGLTNNLFWRTGHTRDELLHPGHGHSEEDISHLPPCSTMFLITLAIPCGLRWRWVEQKWIQWIARCVLRLKRGPWICPCCNSVIMSCTGGLACILHFKIITFCLENYPDDGLVKETSGGYSFILANLWKVERKGLKRPLIHVIQLRLLWFLGRFSLWQRQHWEQHCDGCVQYDEE